VDVYNFITQYQKNLQRRIEDISVALSSGSASDWEDYKARVGEIQGVTYALDELKALLKKANYVEDTDST
tara:strand:+ start:98 stop:307 length:210 start_codon:yes stop_codon:yes gene_type:complete